MCVFLFFVFIVQSPKVVPEHLFDYIVSQLEGRPDEPPRQAVGEATASAMTARVISSLNDVDEYERNCKSLAHGANPTAVAHPG